MTVISGKTENEIFLVMIKTGFNSNKIYMPLIGVYH